MKNFFTEYVDFFPSDQSDIKAFDCSSSTYFKDSNFFLSLTCDCAGPGLRLGRMSATRA